MSPSSRPAPRHALDCHLTPEIPDRETRAAMAAFYRTNEGYARQQASHGAAYFARLLSVMDAVLSRSPLSILEVGAGASGAMLAFLQSRPRVRAIAMEMAPVSVPKAMGAGARALQGVAGDALALPFRSRSVDAVVAFEVIEHLPDVMRALDEMLRVLKRPGWVVIGLPNHASLWTPFEDALRRRNRLAFGVERGRGAWRWWRRNAGLAWRKRLSRQGEFLYRQPILEAAQGGDADAVYYAAPIDLIRFFADRGAQLAATSATVRFGPVGRLIPVELQGATVLAWKITEG